MKIIFYLLLLDILDGRMDFKAHGYRKKGSLKGSFYSTYYSLIERKSKKMQKNQCLVPSKRNQHVQLAF